MNSSVRRVLTLFVTLAGLAGVCPAAEWHHPLYLDGGGYWRSRLPVEVRNDQAGKLEGRPMSVEVSTGTAAGALLGRRVEAIRVTDAQGVEMLFAVYAPGGKKQREGAIADGSRLVLPITCAAKDEARYYVYFENPRAGAVPRFLDARPGLTNGDVELGSGDVPDGWVHDRPDTRHRASWSEEDAQSGRRCLKTVVAQGAEPSWIASRQGGIPIVGGAKYRFQAWVKGENVRGSAGWFLHVGNAQEAMLSGPVISAGEGSFDWKKIECEFTAPAAADRLSLGTVLRGTGTAWFDNARLECLEPGAIRLDPGPVERISLAEFPRGAKAAGWPDNLPAHRAVAVAFNYSQQPIRGALVSVDLGMIEARMRGHLDPGSLRVIHGGKVIAHARLGTALLFEADLPARSRSRYEIYFGGASATGGGERAGATSLLSRFGGHNLVRNPGFEQRDPQRDSMPEAWTASGPPRGGDGVTFGLDSPGRAELGHLCGRMQVPAGSAEAWRGWHQSVPVRPGRTYLLAGWLKCEGVDHGEVRIHAHRHNAQGGLVRRNAMTSLGQSIRGTTDWTLTSGLFTMPEDTVELELHLTMNTTGTVWHDGVVLAEVTPGRIVRLEGRPMRAGARPAVWQVPSVVKVFGDDPAPGESSSAASIASARNEWETLQLAIRSPVEEGSVRVEVDPPAGPGGAVLESPEVNVVGFVPIDHATSYYSSSGPAWIRMFPRRPGGCDGWAGLWPDPLLPTATFELGPNRTQPIWLTFRIPRQARAGEYRGRVRFVAGQKVVAAMPYRLRVWDFALPETSHVGAIYDVRLGPGAGLWGKSLEEIYPEIVRFMARRRLCPDTIRPVPRMRYVDGRVEADFTEYDRAAGMYFDELKLPFAYTPWTFYLFGWGHPPKTFSGERPYEGEFPYTGVDRSVLRPEYKRAYQACLKVFWDHLKEKGWEKKVILYISDEPYDRHEYIRRQMQALCEMIHEVDATIPIYSSTWKHVPDWDGSLDVWGIGHDGRVPVEKMAELRAAGDRIWFTTDGQMCIDTPYCAVERLLPHYCFQYGAQAYEFWGVAWLTYNPYRWGWHSYIRQSGEPGEFHYVRYPNGDGFLLYPGGPIGHQGLVSSIRLEQAREGVEDFEYLRLLTERIARAKQNGGDTTEAQAALEAAAGLVTVPNAGGRYSSRILPQPEKLYRVRRQVGQAIESLGR